MAPVHWVLEDPGPDPTWIHHADENYDVVLKSLPASHPDGPDAWLFAYGSLIWKPEIEYVEIRKGTMRGWHGSFCFRIMRFRGSKEQSGLTMCSTEAASHKAYSSSSPRRTWKRSLASWCGGR